MDYLTLVISIIALIISLITLFIIIPKSKK